MGKITELKTTTDKVLHALREYPETRNSDDLLYYRVCKSIDEVSVNASFAQIMINRKNYGFPAFESVRRSRQKIQAIYPELCGNPDVEGARRLNEDIFKDFATGVL